MMNFDNLEKFVLALSTPQWMRDEIEASENFKAALYAIAGLSEDQIKVITEVINHATSTSIAPVQDFRWQVKTMFSYSLSFDDIIVWLKDPDRRWR